MSEGDTILVNGFAYDHASLRIRIDGDIEHRIKAMEYGDGTEGITHLYGTSRYPIAMTRGQYKPKDPSIDFYRIAWDERVAKMGDLIYTRQFTIEVERSERGGPFTKDILVGCKFNGGDHSTTEGGDPLLVKVALSCLFVRTNSTNPLPNMRY